MLFMDAKTWSCRPSDLLRIEDDYVAYCLDQAVGHFGRVVENELQSVEAKTVEEANYKRRQILDQYLNPDSDKPARGMYADPAAMM